jgi:hypothetical protein
MRIIYFIFFILLSIFSMSVWNHKDEVVDFFMFPKSIVQNSMQNSGLDYQAYTKETDENNKKN